MDIRYLVTKVNNDLLTNYCSGIDGCGALIIDQVRHTEFHKRIERLENRPHNPGAHH